MSRDGIIGSLFDHFHYFMISQSTLFLRLKNYKTWSFIPGTTVIEFIFLVIIYRFLKSNRIMILNKIWKFFAI